MTRAEKQEILNMPTVAVCDTYPGGLEVKSIEYGIDDRCVCVTQTMTSEPRVHRVKINYLGDRPYMIIDGFRIYADDCIK